MGPAIPAKEARERAALMRNALQKVELLKRSPAWKLLRSITPAHYAHFVKIRGSRKVETGTGLEAMRQALKESDSISIYLHIPTCTSLCRYCHYPVLVSKPGKAAEHAGKFAELLLRESEIFLSIFPRAAETPVTSASFGGGTPSLLRNADLSSLLAHVRKSFLLSPGCEVGIEGTPETFSKEKVSFLKDLGITRVSFGVQALDDGLLRKIRRNHSSEQALEALALLANSGIPTINVDLIYGFPGQDLESYVRTAQQIASRKPTSITQYRLRLGRADERMALLAADFNRDPASFPPYSATLAMQIAGRAVFESKGYAEGPSGWFVLRGHAKPQIYADRWVSQTPIVAFGFGAYSYSRSYLIYNQKNAGAYERSLRNGLLPIKAATILSQAQQQKYFACFRLKDRFELDCAEFKEKFGVSPLGKDCALSNAFTELENHGLASIDGSKIKLTESGRVLIEDIFTLFFGPVQ